MKRYVSLGLDEKYLTDKEKQFISDYEDDLIEALNNNIDKLKSQFDVTGDIVFTDASIKTGENMAYISFTNGSRSYTIDMDDAGLKAISDLEAFRYPVEQLPKLSKVDLNHVFKDLVAEWGNKF